MIFFCHMINLQVDDNIWSKIDSYKCVNFIFGDIILIYLNIIENKIIYL